ncbi:type VI secretion system contractile sheath small subunit [Francisella adeliensis]|uniref:Type VI secretion system contractile sheath small subunit n=1 Tax=Francisella adeliensis TaxID=2007306 RepID=A0A2Z4Y238_9GAMM|nr:type VI secretion system contractile sheath small subunit [Francisella adeliensis]AXA34585.1 type VI secretion system-associated protein [Francisella adeliensis]MBK2086309.1 type VI secretion system contractile sheath small subunit [Francisella adeliensis]MBK2096525.1 type VI secretion system contractile sheath small subunit [Francisella adeliensis]QIW12830.1 type VI secretion system contractile sheath small subunit [Francisella adeliensis]QIW14707.1 type VI secretion system contractile she
MINNLIPKSRVNITYEMEVNGVKKAKELPFKQLILADLSNGTSKDREKNLGEREIHEVAGPNLNELMSKMNINYSASISNCIDSKQGVLKVGFKIDSIKSFNPNKIAENIPELTNLIQLKKLLKEYESCIDNNRNFRNLVNRLLNQKDDLDNIKKQLPLDAAISYKIIAKEKGENDE